MIGRVKKWAAEKSFSVDLLSSIAIGAMVLHILKGHKKHY
jgi:hypothetical protein